VISLLGVLSFYNRFRYCIDGTWFLNTLLLFGLHKGKIKFEVLNPGICIGNGIKNDLFTCLGCPILATKNPNLDEKEIRVGGGFCWCVIFLS